MSFLEEKRARKNERRRGRGRAQPRSIQQRSLPARILLAPFRLVWTLVSALFIWAFYLGTLAVIAIVIVAIVDALV